MNKIMRHKNKNVLHGVIMVLSRKHKKILRNEFHKVNLTEGKPKILDFLLINPGCSQRELATRCHIEPATATSVLALMEKEDLIYRSRNEKDKRILNVYLTEKGIEAQENLDKIFEKVDELCFEGFSEEEKIQAINYLNRINENLNKGDKEID
ncbi:MAG: MarR family winged helix-turn-helix transcriptional regulator [Peptostreptococcaceae bacterium]